MALSTKQKWFIGCGGCLVVILVIVGILIAVGMGIKGTSDKAVQSIFGPVPAGYISLGLPMDAFGGNPSGSAPKDFAMLISEQNRSLWLAFDMKLSAEEKAIFQTSDGPTLQAHLTKLLEENASTSEQAKVQDLSVIGVNTVNLQNLSQKIRVIQLKINSKKGVMPAILTPIDETTGNTLLLVGLESGQSSSDSKDFGPSYINLSEEASALISGTAIHSRMQPAK